MSKLHEHIFEKLETYKDLFDNAHDLIHVLQPDGTIIYVNNAWRKNSGYSEEEIQGKSIYSLVRVEDRDRFRQYRESILNGSHLDNEITVGLATKTGSIIFIEGAVSAKFVDGKPFYTRGIFRNVTRRLHNEAQLKLLNEQLRERESNLQQLFFYAPDAIIVIDTESIVRYWNPKAEKIFGWEQSEVVGKSLSEIIIPPQYREAHKIGMQRYLATSEARVLNKTIEITSLHKGGREFYVALTISATYQNGQPAFIAFIRDIDEQKMNERELAQKKAQLEVSNQQLEQFAHVASHDMKEPIRKILMFAEGMQSEIAHLPSEKSRIFLSKIESAATRLAQMVDGVLRNSIIKAEEVIFETVDLNGVIKNIETDLELLIEKNRASIKYDRLLSLQGSSFLLYQLFYNLINNSLKFSRPDVPVIIEVTSSIISSADVNEPTVHPGASYVKILLKDNGIGFRQAYAQSIFKTFTRLHPKDKYEGTGIGLSLCKSIVEKHNGFIHALGKEGEGATFVIVLPLNAS